MIVLALTGIFLRVMGTSFGVGVNTLLDGLAIVAAAFLLSWSSEAAQLDLSQGLALAIVALITVLPEYAVDVTFTWKAGKDPQFAPYALANMTGANRRLIGIAWPLVFGVFWLKTRKRLVDLERGHAIEILTLTLATVYAFTFLLKREIGLIDTVVLGVLFLVYITLIAKAPTEEPHLIGPARTIGTLPRYARYLTIGALLVYAAIAIFAVADPFAEGLIETGSALGVDEFLMVQLITLIARRASLRTLIRTTREVAAEYRRGAA